MTKTKGAKRNFVGGRNRHLVADNGASNKVDMGGSADFIADLADQINREEVTKEQAIELLRDYLQKYKE